MCGIAGYVNLDGPAPEDPSTVATMVAALHHRGPDGRGVFCAPGIGLGHARLSIIDLAGGAQPLTNEDGTVVVSFNGEIFNFVELRAELLRRGHVFQTRSDTEVLVHLYEDLGDAFLQRLNGQFALAIWDARRRRLLLARDRHGIRPLVYCRAGGRVWFASEAKALFAAGALRAEIDPRAVAEALTYWAPLPGQSAFKGLNSLPPGHQLVIEPGREPALARWWGWEFPPEGGELPISMRVAAEATEALLEDAVRLQLRSDVPVAAYLSGGIDSSLITALVNRLQPGRMRTFSIVFPDAEFDERPWQRKLSTALGTDHQEVQVSGADIAASFMRFVRHVEAPVVRTAGVPLMLLADAVRSAGFRVALSGEGADEMFAGYDVFKEAKLRRWLARTPDSRWRARLLGRLYPYLPRSPVAGGALAGHAFLRDLARAGKPDFAHSPRWTTTQRAWQFLTPAALDAAGQARDDFSAATALLPPGSEAWSCLARDQYLEAATLMSEYLLVAQGDRPAMAASVEVRVPFLDHRISDWAARLPPRLKLRGLTEKCVLRHAGRGLLPAEFQRRPKQPYRAPESTCFFAGGRPLPWVSELLSASSLRAAGLFSPTAVERLVVKCAAGRAGGFADNMAFVGILSTMALHATFCSPGGDPFPRFPASA